MTAFTPTSSGQRLRLYLDEDITERLLDVLPAFGIDVVSANHGHKGLTDPEQLLVAIGLGRTMVTTNTGDFLLLHQAWHAWSGVWDLRTLPRHRGILLVHSAKGYDFIGIAGVLRAFVEDRDEAGAIDNRALVWNSDLGWHEKP